MPGVTQPKEYPGKFSDKLEAMVAQERSRRRGKLSKEQEKTYRVVCKEALRKEALDKIEFSLRGEIRRKRYNKMNPPMTVDEFSNLWRKKMRERLEQDGYLFELTAEEKKIIEQVKADTTKKKMDEATQMAAEALKKVILSA